MKYCRVTVGIRRCRKIITTDSSGLLLAHCLSNVVMDNKQSSFSGMRFSVGRFKVLRRLLEEKTSKFRFNNLLREKGNMI
jgi:hypothetical protein